MEWFKWLCAKVVLLSLLVLPVQAVSASVWQQTNGPIGVTTYVVAIDPNSSQILYAGTSGGVFKSINGGSSWSAVNNGLQNYTNSGPFLFSALTMDKNGILYAGASAGIQVGVRGGVYKSTDGGASWSVKNTGLAGEVFISSLVVDPNNDQVIYAGGGYGVYKSSDGGGSWSKVTTGLYMDVTCLAIDPNSSQTIYAGTVAFYSGSIPYPGGVYKSVNGGTSWNPVNTGLARTAPFNATVMSLAIDPTNSQILYAGTNAGGVFKSTDAGGAWSLISNGMSFAASGTANAIVVDPAASQTLYAGTSNGSVYNSSNGGSSWNVVASGLSATSIYYIPSGGVWANASTTPLPPPVTPPATPVGGLGVFMVTALSIAGYGFGKSRR